MAMYYDGDLKKDIERLKEDPTEDATAITLDTIGKQIGYGRAQQILQILWAKHLQDNGSPTMGALFR